MNDKFVLAFIAIFMNVISQIFIKSGMGYKAGGVQVVPDWAQKLGARPIELTVNSSFGGQLLQLFSNIPVLVGIAAGLVFFVFFTTLVSRAGLGFANAMMTLFFVIITYLSHLLFNEYLGGLKLVGIVVIVLGFILVSIGEYQADLKGLLPYK